ADAEERKCAPLGVGLCRSAWARLELGGARDATRRCAGSQAAARLLDLVVGAVRISRAGDPKAEGRCPGYAGDHLRLALSDFPPFCRRVADHGDAALRPGRRL